ncbi:MAG: VWA domain-containing protein [Bdellovibrionales bacterium]|nr:VWA domain-containing protein [Bdellovibrionales bacterium]
MEYKREFKKCSFNLHRLFVKFFLLLVGLILSLGCSDVRLQKIAPTLANVEGKGQFCITEPQEVKRKTKFLFVVDKSGSNSSTGDGTDPGAEKRAGNIDKFLRANLNSSNQEYGLLWFAGTKAGAFIYGQNESDPTFTPDIRVALQAVQALRQEDAGETPYRAALNLARTAISNDKKKNTDEESFYMVFFVSDGDPTDIQNNEELKQLVQDVLSVDKKNIALSTGFYGSGDQSAQERLQLMAQVGNGKFINFEQGAEWNFNDLLVKPTFEPWQLKNQLMVYNLNAGFCEDGRIDVDSDMDGMCDVDELRWGFDPSNRFSQHDGYGDYFHWREKKYRETLPPCLDQSDEDHDFLTACEEAYVRNEHPVAGLPKSSNPLNPDTDGDGIIDGIEAFVYMTNGMAVVIDPFNLQSNLDGEEPARRQIEQHRSPLIRDPNQTAYDTTLTPIIGQPLDCYDYRQTILPLYNTRKVPFGSTLAGLEHEAYENVVSVHYIQTHQSDPNGNGLFRYSLQKLINDEPTRLRIGSNLALQFKDTSFKTLKFKFNE